MFIINRQMVIDFTLDNLPHTLNSVIISRISKLDNIAQLVLRVASVLGIFISIIEYFSCYFLLLNNID